MDQRSTRKSRTGSSPPRPHHNALSSLQALSPLQTTGGNLASFADDVTDSPASAGLLSRSSSGRTLSRSLSGRERVFSDAAAGAGSAGATGLRRRSSGAENIPAGITTRLILVKAPSDKDATPLRQRSKSSSNLVPVSSFAAFSDAPATSRAPRRSFAAASFSLSPPPISAAGGGGSPVRRPSLSAAAAAPGGGAAPTPSKTLSPDEVLELARGLMSPVAATTGAESAKAQRRKSLTNLAGEQEPEPIALEPVEYVEMDDDTLLPFSDRPAQVASLLANPVNETLVDLLSKSFPAGAARPNWKEIPVTEWNWTEFERLLTKIDREECPDYEWVLLAREAVRERSVALWEKLGVCLGCDPELMTAGDEDEAPASWVGLGLGDEGEYDPTLSRVFIQGLEPVDPVEIEKAERALMLEFGDPVDGSESPEIQWNDVMPTIGEEPSNGGGGQPSAGNREVKDYFDESPGGTRHRATRDDAPPSPSSVFASSFASTSASLRGSPEKSRSKSFVGLQICTAPVSPFSTAGLSLSPAALAHDQQPQFDRGPGNPMFVSSFNTLSIGPNLGRKASMSAAGGGAAAAPPPMASADVIRGFGRSSGKYPGLTRKSSKAGISESAITFVSEDSFPPHHR
ncbi:hypothetical protein Q8F55_007964 [Vanrija albida]|uniref:Uncharacterized protein n=1 Tax=Vanrija albida TaxID=181172 RepID=A0ABR3PUZ7_9TREE